MGRTPCFGSLAAFGLHRRGRRRSSSKRGLVIPTARLTSRICGMARAWGSGQTAGTATPPISSATGPDSCTQQLVRRGSTASSIPRVMRSLSDMTRRPRRAWSAISGCARPVARPAEPRRSDSMRAGASPWVKIWISPTKADSTLFGYHATAPGAFVTSVTDPRSTPAKPIVTTFTYDPVYYTPETIVRPPDHVGVATAYYRDPLRRMLPQPRVRPCRRTGRAARRRRSGAGHVCWSFREAHRLYRRSIRRTDIRAALRTSRVHDAGLLR